MKSAYPHAMAKCFPAGYGILVLVMMQVGCNNNSTIDLTEHGIEAEIEVPSAASAVPEVFSGDVILSDGDRFRIRLSRGAQLHVL